MGLLASEIGYDNRAAVSLLDPSVVQPPPLQSEAQTRVRDLNASASDQYSLEGVRQVPTLLPSPVSDRLLVHQWLISVKPNLKSSVPMEIKDPGSFHK
ncbi:Hypothetical predicted protein [Scomber scombrus]|uniref:Uncharacterized protein n=1 Tax=Scomber scombrus TaxID=13677 RepID=A0AAV1QAA7_SCOSC